MNIQAQSQALRRLAAQLVRNDAEADDLAQDAWVDALQNPPASERPAEPWLRTVLRNRRVTNLRAQVRRTRREEAAPASPRPPSAEQIQVGRELLEHLAALPEADRDLLTLRYWEALTLNECAERLGISASTARSRHARALTKLRERLDTRAGGREAWLSALAPWLINAPPAASTSPLSFASLSVGGVLAGACLWLLSGLNPGCGATETDTETVAPEGIVRDTPPPQNAPATVAAAAPSQPVDAAPAEVDFDAEKHPCDRPIAPADAPSMAEVLRTGKKLTSDQFMKAFLECKKLHGPPSLYTAKEGNTDGSVHPLLSATMSMQHIWPAMRQCYAGSEPARARLAFSFWLHEDGAMTVGEVTTVHSEGLNADQIACVEGSVSVAEIDLRKGDSTKMGLPPNTALEMPRLVEVELKDSGTKTVGSGHRPSRHLGLQDKEQFASELAACGSGPMGASLHWDPETGELLEVIPDPTLSSDTATCLGRLLKAQLQPNRQLFFPRSDADTHQHCAFTDSKPKCDGDPLFQVVKP